MVSDELMKRILGNLSAEGIDRQRKHQYRQGYLRATEAEIQMLVDADDKAGYPPSSLGHARYILRSKVGARLPMPTAKDFDDAVRAVVAASREHKAWEAIRPDYSWASDMAWAQRLLQKKWEDTELARHASKRERKVREVAALVIARTLKWVAEQNGDRELMAHGIELERRALKATKLYAEL